MSRFRAFISDNFPFDIAGLWTVGPKFFQTAPAHNDRFIRCSDINRRYETPVLPLVSTLNLISSLRLCGFLTTSQPEEAVPLANRHTRNSITLNRV